MCVILQYSSFPVFQCSIAFKSLKIGFLVKYMLGGCVGHLVVSDNMDDKRVVERYGFK